MNKILHTDIINLIKNQKYFNTFDNSSVLITGCTGLIGSTLVYSLCEYNKTYNKNIKIYANYRNQKLFDSMFDEYKKFIFPIFSDIKKLNFVNLNIDYIIHTASITDSKTFINKPIETIFTGIDGIKNILNQCINKPIKGIVFLSSLEIYGTFLDTLDITTVTEKDYGYLDPLSIRSSYSESKRMIENICVSYFSEYKIPVKIARLCQIFGAGVKYNDERVFAQFARSIIENKNILLKTNGETIRNYCYITDAVSGILTVLAKGNAGEAYNIANKNTTISIKELAENFCHVNNFNSKIIYDIENNPSRLGYNPTVKIQLDTTKLEKLDWTATIGLEQSIINLINGMKIEKI